MFELARRLLALARHCSSRLRLVKSPFLSLCNLANLNLPVQFSGASALAIKPLVGNATSLTLDRFSFGPGVEQLMEGSTRFENPSTAISLEFVENTGYAWPHAALEVTSHSLSEMCV